MIYQQLNLNIAQVLKMNLNRYDIDNYKYLQIMLTTLLNYYIILLRLIT